MSSLVLSAELYDCMRFCSHDKFDFDTILEVQPGVHVVALLYSWLSGKACYKFEASMFLQDHGIEVVSALISSE